jgi:uncharacterized protein YjbI with pentapeptide repeats
VIRGSVAAVLAAMTVLASSGASAAGAEPGAPATQEIKQMFLQNATRGTFEKIPGTGLYRLRLEGVSPRVTWFSDRPARDAGVIPVRGFVESWRGFGFSADHPNAALTITGARSRGHTVVLELSRPRYTAARRTLRYIARPIRAADGNLASFEARRNARLPRQFGASALFIDDATAIVLNGCVLQPYSQCPGVDLATGGKDLDLQDLILNNINFSGANLAMAMLGQVNLTDANLSGANLAGAYLRNTHLDGADLSGADLRGATLVGAMITNANLTAATLDGADFHCAHIYWDDYCYQQQGNGSSVYLNGSDLTGASLRDADLSWSNFSGVNLTGADLTGAIGYVTIRESGTATWCRTVSPFGNVDNQDCPDT